MVMTSRARLAVLFALASLVWALLLVAIPGVASRWPTAGFVTAVSAPVYVAGGFVCHQGAERSFHPWGMRMPVCARCFGLYASAPFGAAIGVFVGSIGAVGRRRRLTVRRLRVVLVLAALPTGIIWLVEWLGVAHPSSLVRAALAVPLGAAVGWAVSTAIGREIG